MQSDTIFLASNLVSIWKQGGIVEGPEMITFGSRLTPSQSLPPGTAKKISKGTVHWQSATPTLHNSTLFRLSLVMIFPRRSLIMISRKACIGKLLAFITAESSFF